MACRPSDGTHTTTLRKLDTIFASSRRSTRHEQATPSNTHQCFRCEEGLVFLLPFSQFLTAVVPPKAKGRKRNRDMEKPLSGLNVDELLHREKRFRISSDNSIPEFKQMLATTEDIEGVEDAVSQLGSIIEARIENSLSDTGYQRVVEELGVMRSEMVEFEEPELYNRFIRRLKSRLLGEELGGDRREMWWLVRTSGIGLIDRRSSSLSEVTEQEAKEVSTISIPLRTQDS